MAAAARLSSLSTDVRRPIPIAAPTCSLRNSCKSASILSCDAQFGLRTDCRRLYSQRNRISPGILFPPLKLTYPRCGIEEESKNVKSLKASRKSGKRTVVEAAEKDAGFAGTAGALASTTTSTATPPPPPVESYPGSPLMWIGVGVAVAVGFSWLSKRVQQTMMQQMMKSVMSQTGPRGAQGNMFGGQMPFPPPPSPSSPAWQMPPPPSPPLSPSPPPSPSPSPSTASTPSTPTSPLPDTRSSRSSSSDKASSAPKKSVFQDVSVDIVSEAEAAASRAQEKKSFPEVEVLPSFNSRDSRSGNDGSWDSSASSSSASGTQGGGSEGRASAFTVDQLEKMMEDPMVQQMIYPYLPEEMRNPETFKWMMQSPDYRRQLEEMLQNMGGGGGAWDSKMGDMFKNFDLNSTEVKQQFDQIGMTPQEVVSKIMANPEVAMAFAKPNIQAAILDCSQNPLHIAKYTNDPEVMKVFTQISELFPGLKT